MMKYDETKKQTETVLIHPETSTLWKREQMGVVKYSSREEKQEKIPFLELEMMARITMKEMKISYNMTTKPFVQ